MQRLTAHDAAEIVAGIRGYVIHRFALKLMRLKYIAARVAKQKNELYKNGDPRED